MRVYQDFFLYPDPDQRFLKRIRILIRANDTDPTGSGSETLDWTLSFKLCLSLRLKLYFILINVCPCGELACELVELADLLEEQLNKLLGLVRRLNLTLTTTRPPQIYRDYKKKEHKHHFGYDLL